MSDVTKRRPDTDPAALRCYALGAVSCLFGVLAPIAPNQYASEWANVVSGVLTAILIGHVVNMVLRVR
jgi:hypothetical protein